MLAVMGDVGAPSHIASLPSQSPRRLCGINGLPENLLKPDANSGKKKKNFFKVIGKGVKSVGKFVQKVGKAVVPKGAFSTIGSTAGTMLGGPAGGGLGGVLGSKFADIVGFGDYTQTIKNNSLWNRTNKQRLGQMGFTGDGGRRFRDAPLPTFRRNGRGIEICHREFVCDIVDSQDYAVTGFQLNPANSALFPWLSRIAHYFEEYEFNGLIMEYRPSSGMVAATAALGTVMYATNYNCTEPLFQSKAEIDSYEFATSCLPCDHMMHPVECAKTANPLQRYYIRAVDSPDGELMYDMGTFQYATKGMPTGGEIRGELWVSYDVTLLKPRVNVRGPNIEFWYGTNTAGTCTAANPLTTITEQPESNGAWFVVASTTTFRLPFVGTWQVLIDWTGAAMNAVPTVAYGANIVVGVHGLDQGLFLAAGTRSMYNAVLNVTHAGNAAANTGTVTGPGAMAAANCAIYCARIPHLPLTLEGKKPSAYTYLYTAPLTIPKQPPTASVDDEEDDYEYVRKKKSR
jgi:hypothetical protein